MPNQFTERFFILTPTLADKPAEADSSGNVAAFYLDASGMEMKWSAKFPLPAIGDQIVVTMNRIGPAVVKGYFESCGWLGLMALPTNPPDWLVKQQKREPGKLKWQREGIGCFFGAEIKLP